MGSGSSKQRWKIVALAVPLFVGVTGIGLYLAVTQPDRDIARLQDELRQFGLQITDDGRSRASPDRLVELGKQLQNTDRIPWRDRNHPQRAQHLKDTEQIYGKIKTVDFDVAQGDDDLAAPMYLTRAMQHCLHRTTFYLDSDPQKSLEALKRRGDSQSSLLVGGTP